MFIAPVDMLSTINDATTLSHSEISVAIMSEAPRLNSRPSHIQKMVLDASLLIEIDTLTYNEIVKTNAQTCSKESIHNNVFIIYS